MRSSSAMSSSHSSESISICRLQLLLVNRGQGVERDRLRGQLVDVGSQLQTPRTCRVSLPIKARRDHNALSHFWPVLRTEYESADLQATPSNSQQLVPGIHFTLLATDSTFWAYKKDQNLFGIFLFLVLVRILERYSDVTPAAYETLRTLRPSGVPASIRSGSAPPADSKLPQPVTPSDIHLKKSNHNPERPYCL